MVAFLIGPQRYSYPPMRKTCELGFSGGQYANALINPTLERLEKFSAKNNGECPLGHEIDEENEQGGFAMLFIKFPERCFYVHSFETGSALRFFF